jgi:hypothetical protein
MATSIMAHLAFARVCPCLLNCRSQASSAFIKAGSVRP